MNFITICSSDLSGVKAGGQNIRQINSPVSVFWELTLGYASHSSECDST